MKANIDETFKEHIDRLVAHWEYNVLFFTPEVSERGREVSKLKLKEWKKVKEQLKYGNCLLSHRQLKELEQFMYGG